MLDPKKLPVHLAIIMDGNGRWAKKQLRNRIFGHTEGVKRVNEITTECAKLGIKYLTLYSFSEENWDRPASEIKHLMWLLQDYLVKEKPTMMKNNIRLLAIGDISKLPKKSKETLLKIMDETKNNTGLKLILALSYGARQEILNGIKSLISDLAVSGKSIDEIDFNDYLYTKGIPDPDFLIRTGGEYRVSNFLLWQIAYTELYTTHVLWPDFTKEELVSALHNYTTRTRRFGKI